MAHEFLLAYSVSADFWAADVNKKANRAADRGSWWKSFRTDRDLSSEMSFGYDEDFVSPIDEDLQCSICYLALREPVLTRCGHRFCRQCLDRHMARFVSSFYVRK